MENLNIDKENKVENSIKKNLNFVFKENPKLLEIGTMEEYSEYIDNIFPETKFKEIFFHGTKSKNIFESEDWNINFNDNSAKNLGKGYYFSPEKDRAEGYLGRDGGTMIYSVLNIKNPVYTDINRNSNKGLYYAGNISTKELVDISGGGDSIFGIEYADTDNYKKINKYLEIYNGPLDNNGFPVRQEIYMRVPEVRELSLVDKSQIHILGSEKDLKDFQKFVELRNKKQDEKYLV